MKALDQGDIFYDPILNAVLQADGTFSMGYSTHAFTMLWPSYSAIDLHDNVISRLIPAQYDHWSNKLQYFDSVAGVDVVIDLTSGTSSQHQTVFNSQSTSQKNQGWAQEPPKPKFPFAPKSILFHKQTRTKWIFDEIDSLTRHPVLRSFYDKSQAMQILEQDYIEFEEIFF